MPLSAPSSDRQLIHHRRIDCKGYQREDGLWDIEGYLVDVKTYDIDNFDRGTVRAGEPVHDMWLRITLDEDFLIHEAEAVTDASPYYVCPAITENFRKLKGIQIKPGWRKAVNKLLGGTSGCTHLVELLNPLATAAFQSMYLIKAREIHSSHPDKKPFLLDTCHAFARNSPVVKRQWPEYYKVEDE